MAALVLGAVGASLGGSLLGSGIVAFGLTGGAIGWTIGSTIGGILGQKAVHTVGPGIGDKAIQASTYGAFQTLLYGTLRVSGNVIDGVSELREVRTTTKVGKGGPKGTNTTLSWNADVAIDLAQAGAQGIRKIWNNGKLIYDVSTGGTASSIIASSVRATSFKLYDGSETQLPDPTLEAIHGAGNVPAYRGRSYCVFAGLDCPNGQIPQLSFEVCMSIAAAATLPIFTPAVPFQPELNYNDFSYSRIDRVCGPDMVYHATANYESSPGYRISLQGFRAGNGFLQKLFTVALPSYGTGQYRLLGMNGSHKRPMLVRATLGLNGVYTSTNTLSVINLLTGAETVLRTFVPGVVANDLAPGSAAYDEVTDRFVLMGNSGGGGTYERFNPGIYSTTGGLLIRLATLNSTTGYPIAFYNGIVYLLDLRSGVGYVQSYSAATGAFLGEVAGGPATLDITTPSFETEPLTGVIYSGWVTAISAHAGGVFVYSKTTGQAWRIDTAWREVSATVANSTNTLTGVENAWIEQDYIVEGPLIAAPDAAAHYRVAATRSFNPLDVTSGSIINDVCQRAGLTAGQVDTTACVDTLRGYAITRQSSARANVEPLLKAFFIDSREQDGKVQFIQRAAQTSSFTVSFDELAASESATDTPDALPLARTDITTLPRSVTVSFMDQDADYQTGTQAAMRQTVANINEQSDELPMAITASRAATVADVLLFDAWSQANRRTASLSRRYAAVSPGDVGTFEYPQGTFTAKRVQRVNDSGALVTLDLVDSDAPIYSASLPGTAQPAGQVGLALVPPTRMALLDIPLLRDVDDDNGIYVALAPYTPSGWNGAALYKGNDDSTLSVLGSVTTAASVGIATTLLGDWPDNTPDWLNTVVVEEMDALASSTLDGCLNGGDNLILIGSELLQFITATSISAGKYRLSGLVRGRKGTERYKSTHAAFEQAVLLPASGDGLLRPVLDIGELGQLRMYRPISLGLAADSMPSTAFASTGEGLKPLSPVDFHRTALNGASAMTVNRRSRYTGELPDGADIALGEASELYDWDIYADATYALVVRTLTSVTGAVTYTLAQQLADFGGYQATLYVRIHQVSALVGRGNPLQVASTVANTNSTPPSLLAHMDGAGLITTPLDSGPYLWPAALQGTAALSNAQGKFGGSSLYIPDTSSRCIFDTSSASHSFGTGDGTVAFWFYGTTASAGTSAFSIAVSTALASLTEAALNISMDLSALTVTARTYAGGAALDGNVTTPGGSFALNAWTHLAVCWRGAVLYVFVNGVLKASGAKSVVTAMNYASNFKSCVGGWNNGTDNINGIYYDDVLVLKGEALYFADFTPPAAPYSY